MRDVKYIFCFVIFIVTGLSLHSQTKSIDSLKLALKKAKHDTVRCQILSQLAETASDEEWPAFNQELKTLSEKNLATSGPNKNEIQLYRKYLAAAFGNCGYLEQIQGNIPKAISYFEKSMKLQEENRLPNGKLVDELLMATTLNNIGGSYREKGDAVTALSYYQKSLKQLEELKDQKGIAQALNNIGLTYYRMGETEKGADFFIKALNIRKSIRLPDGSIGDKNGIAESLGNIGSLYKERGDSKKAIDYFFQSLNVNIEIGDKESICQSLNNIGSVYQNQGDIPKALDYYGRCLQLQEKMGYRSGIASSLNNIGMIYHTQGDILTAIEYMKKSLSIREEMDDRFGISQALVNIGAIYLLMGDPSIKNSKKEARMEGIKKALAYFTKSKAMQEEIGDKRGLATTLNNFGTAYEYLGEFSRSLEFHLQSLELRKQLDDKKGIATAHNNIGWSYFYQKKYNKALEFSTKSKAMSFELGFPSEIENAAQLSYRTNKIVGDHRNALENFELYIKMRDSVNNEKTRRASIKSQLKYEYEKQAAADSVAHTKENEIKSAELSRQSAEIKAKKNQQIALFGGLFLVILFAGFMFNRFKVTQKQKGIIEHQKEIVEEQKKLVEEKQREVLDSIKYAKRIQMAQIPTEKQVGKSLERLKKK